MSVQISCLTKHSTKPIIFTLIGNDFTDLFLEKLKWVKEIYHFESYNYCCTPKPYRWNPEKIKQFESSIRNSVQWLNDNGYRFPIPLNEIILENNSVGRSLLNKLHRHFTTGHRTVSHVEPVKTWLENSDYTFEFDYSENRYQDFSQVVHNINTQVHYAERFYVTERMNTFPAVTEHIVVFNSTRPIDLTNDPQNDYFTEITRNDYRYFSEDTDSYDVWLPLLEMQGKNYYGAFFDEDEPTHWDVFTNHYYSGSFCFADRSAMKHPDMISYLQSYGVEPNALTVGIPLGKIIQGKELLEKFGGKDIIDVIIG